MYISKKEIKNNNRNSNIELLRILCIISVIFHHSFVHSNIYTSNSFNFISFYLIQYLGMISNNIFILITGYYMIGKNIKLKSIIKLILESLFYSYLIMILYVIFVGKQDIKMIITSIMPIMSNSQWFITAYIMLYITIPFINILIDNISKKQYVYLILILVTIFSILPTINILKIYFSNYIWFIFLYLVGAYIKKYGSKGLLARNNLLFIVSTILLGILILFNINIIQIKTNNFLIFVLGLSIFVEFINQNEFYNKTINYIASSSLGIYLIHDNFILRPIIWKVVNIEKYMNTTYFWLYEIGVVTIIFGICLIIDKIRQRFIEKPLLTFVYDKLNCIIEKVNNKGENINAE